MFVSSLFKDGNLFNGFTNSLVFNINHQSSKIKKGQVGKTKLFFTGDHVIPSTNGGSDVFAGSSTISKKDNGLSKVGPLWHFANFHFVCPAQNRIDFI